MELTCQEIEVWYILPAIRKEIARALIDKQGFNQKRAAEFLGVTKAAVSQWMSRKRAREAVIDQKTRKNVEEAVGRVIDGKSSLIQEINILCTQMRKSNITCSIHKNHSKNMKDCGICTS